jgi:hypothetical protein
VHFAQQPFGKPLALQVRRNADTNCDAQAQAYRHAEEKLNHEALSLTAAN